MTTKFWVLCVSKMPNARKVKVKILSSEDIPAKGEKLAILGKFNSESDAKLVRKEFGDERIILTWKQNKVIRLV